MWYKGVSIASLGKVRTSERLGDVGVSGRVDGGEYKFARIQ